MILLQGSKIALFEVYQTIIAHFTWYENKEMWYDCKWDNYP